MLEYCCLHIGRQLRINRTDITRRCYRLLSVSFGRSTRTETDIMVKVPEIKYTKLFINNEFVDSVSKKTFPTINPATGKAVAQVAEGDKADVDLAVAAAKAAFHRDAPWRKMGPTGRADLIRKLAELMERDHLILADLVTIDNGKIIKDAIGEAYASTKSLLYYADLCQHISGKTLNVDSPFFAFTLKEPVGIVGQIIPWNFPIALMCGKLGPALAAGCTTVLKPAEQTPLSALHIAALIKEAGFPPGVVNIIPGYGPTAGAAISEHMEIAKVSFTGSTEVGKIVMEAAAKSNLKRVSLELGGKSPLIVFDDSDIDEAVNIAQEAVFVNQGQICCAGSRTFVQDKIYDAFVKKTVERASKRTVGDPFDENITQGPQADVDVFNKVLDLIDSGKKEGAKLEIGGERFGTEGYFIKPTVFSEVKDNMRIATEEIFGPVQQLIRFSTIEEAIERANNTTYGLAAGIITKDINKAIRFAQEVQAGTVWINCYNAFSNLTPFGGYKQSGIGKDMGEEALEEYLNLKSVNIRLSE